MSSFDELLNQFEAPTVADIFIPGKVGALDKGGAAAPSGAAATGKPADSQGTPTGPEPEPELPEGSDPDEPEGDGEDQEEEPPTDDDMEADPLGDEIGFNDSNENGGSHEHNEAVPAQPAEPVVIPRKGGGLTFEGQSVNIKYFPRVLVEEMREMLRPRLGEDFARDLSQFSLVTAFVIAAMGVDITTDDYTAHAVAAFRATDPRTDAIDKRTAVILEAQEKQAETLKKVMKRLGTMEDTLAVIEQGQAYALAERTAQLDTAGATPETIEVTQKRAIASRDNIRRKVGALRRDETIQAGRPIR
ncbi:hypothetical protein [Arthrobacter koreensis]|uniref:hypothetical protein n=1 Tax=Arthrobacter koreensis TaxID=199136 RepID=UPI003804615D